MLLKMKVPTDAALCYHVFKKFCNLQRTIVFLNQITLANKFLTFCYVFWNP